RGGTGEVVQLALTRGTAIVHVPLDPGSETRVLWAAFDPTVITVADDPTVARPLDLGHVDALLTGLLMPPPDEEEQRFLKRFLKERLRQIRTRICRSLSLRKRLRNRCSSSSGGGINSPVSSASTWPRSSGRATVGSSA